MCLMGLDQEAVGRIRKTASELQDDDSDTCLCRDCVEVIPYKIKECPHCGCTDIPKKITCKNCNESFSEDDLDSDACPECGEDPEADVSNFSSEYDANSEIPIAYWRGHSYLHGWMEALWEKKGRPYKHPDWEDFNCANLPLTLEDINQFEADVVAQNLPQANKPKMYSSLEKHLGLKGLFGKDSPDQQHKETDLKFCEDARLAVKNGYEVFYTAYY
jgi:hypothetical protein